jgi:hypothetical protein
MKTIIIIVIVIFPIVSSKAQDDIPKQPPVYPGGIFIEYGFGNYAIKDEYITDQKYSGYIPYFSLNWSRFKNGRGLLLDIESRSTSEIYNNAVACSITQNGLNQDFFYSLGKFGLFKNDVHAYMGPSINILLYTLNYKFGTYNHVTTESNGTIVSLGSNVQFVSNITKKFLAEGSIHLSLASICSKAFQSYKHDEPESKLLLVPKALNTDIAVGLRYYLFNSLSVRVSYKLQVFRINEWDPMISSSNNLIFSLTYHFKKGAK